MKRSLYVIVLFVWVIFIGVSCSQRGDTSEEDTGYADNTTEKISDSKVQDTTDSTGGFKPVKRNPFPWNSETNNEACSNGVDDNKNGYTDCKDFACSRNYAVTVCKDSHYESSPLACSNSIDDDHDGLTDYEDPDCYKNPFHSVCDKPGHEMLCASNGDSDQDGFRGCDDFDCLITYAGCKAEADKRIKVLFDRTADETALLGPNSDWIVDSWGPLPEPSNPQREDQWAGTLSSLGFALHKKGWIIESLVPWVSKITYKDPDNPYDLSRFDILVLWEPSRQLTKSEMNAVVSFVLNGGSLLAVANHEGADRDGNGWASPAVFNDMFKNNTIKKDPFGFHFDEIDVDTKTPVDHVVTPDHPVIKGKNGTVKKIGFYKGCTATITDPDIAKPLLVIDNPDNASSGKVVVGVATPQKGKVVFITDSAVGEDATNSHGNTNKYKDVWDNKTLDNSILLLNAFDWLSKGNIIK